MSEALTRIFDDARAFSVAIARCRNSPFNTAELEDAANRLRQLLDRDHEEMPNLGPSERASLARVFELPDLQSTYHLGDLEAAEERIQRALDSAMKKLL